MKTRNQFWSFLTIAILFLSASILSSCKKSATSPSGPTPPSNPGGYDSANQISPGNLVAYWNFQNSFTEQKQNLSGTNTNATFSTGIKGQAYQGSSTMYSYVEYANPGSALPALNSFTISFWMKANQPVANISGIPAPDSGAQAVFEIVNNAGFWPNLHIDLEPYTVAGTTTPNPDTIQLKLELTSTASGVVWQNQFPTVLLDTAVNKWTQVVLTYNGASGTLATYENGTLTGTNGLGYAYGPFTGSTTLYANDPGSSTNVNNAAVFGNLKFANATALLIGTWQFSTNPSMTSGGGTQAWATSYTGALDELRVYNKALNSTDVKSLYILEKSGF